MIKRTIALLTAVSLFLAGCSSTTVLKTTPPGAKVYINDQFAGTTPYKYSDSKIIFMRNDVRLEKDGYETLYTSFSRSEDVEIGALIGGFLFIVPFFWALKYNPVHFYELKPKSAPPGTSSL